MRSAPFRLVDWLSLALVLALGLGARAWYISECADGGEGEPRWQVQGDDGLGLAGVAAQLRDEHEFAGRPPLSTRLEPTAHISPGYVWLLAIAGIGDWPLEAAVRWGQVVLGALTALLYALFARRAFDSRVVGTVVGFLAALHPYWIINSGELADGVLASFLLAACLFLGTRAAYDGGAFSSLAFGVALAALALVRAALLPFSTLALLWFLPRCRELRQGWLCALLAFLGFANGLAPWLVRNWQTFGKPLPVASSAWLHLYMGNNPRATGSVLANDELEKSLSERHAKLLKEENQAVRYEMLAKDTIEEVQEYPGETLKRRLSAGVVFLLGEPWLKNRALALEQNPTLNSTVVAGPEWLESTAPGLLAASLILLLLLGIVGWRLAYRWRDSSRLATLAFFFVPLPYLLSHAGPLVGPRLPFDGICLCFAGLALCTMLGLIPPAAEENAQ